MKVQRKDLLSKLLLVEPGISKIESLRQSSCVVLRRGRLYTLSNEIACSVLSGLPADWEGAIRADKLTDLLKKSGDDEIEVVLEGGKALRLRGCGRGVFPLEEEIVLPVDDVERPKNWVKLPQEFADAVDLTVKCTKKQGEMMQECIHLTPTWIEGSDNSQVCRWTLQDTGLVAGPVMMRGETIKEVVQLGMTKGCETPNWLHFHNPLGLRMSLRKHVAENYPDFTPFLSMRGVKLELPKLASAAVSRAGVCADERGRIKVTLTRNTITLLGRTEDAEWEEEVKQEVKYRGEPITAWMPWKLLLKMIEDGHECEVTESLFRLRGGSYTYAASLEDR